MYNKFAIWLVSAYIFVSAIPHTPAARYALLGAIILLLILGHVQKRLTVVPNSAIVWSLIIFVGIAFLSAIISPYVTDSLQGFRKDYLPAVLIIVTSTSLNQSIDEKKQFAKIVLYALISGFAVKTALAFWDGAINNPFIFSPYDSSKQIELPKYVSYYAVESTVYFAIAYSTLLFLTKTWVNRLSLFVLCGFSFFIVAASGVRSALLASFAAFFVVTLLKIAREKKIPIFLLTTILTVGIIVFTGRNDPNIARYTTMLTLESYSKNNGMSGRYQIWEGVAELIAQKPFLGHGPGWQKLPEVALETGLLKKWKADPTPYGIVKSEYFSLEKGRVNPHNLFFQILFETGALGLCSYIYILISLGRNALKNCSNEKCSGMEIWQKYTLISFMTAYILIDITNALLLHNTLLALAIISVLINGAKKYNVSGNQAIHKTPLSSELN